MLRIKFLTFVVWQLQLLLIQKLMKLQTKYQILAGQGQRLLLFLTHFGPVSHLYTPWKYFQGVYKCDTGPKWVKKSSSRCPWPASIWYFVCNFINFCINNSCSCQTTNVRNFILNICLCCIDLSELK